MTGKKTEEQKQQEKSKNGWRDEMLKWGVGRERNRRGEEKVKLTRKKKMKDGYEIGKRRRAARKIMTLYCLISQLLL